MYRRPIARVHLGISKRGVVGEQQAARGAKADLKVRDISHFTNYVTRKMRDKYGVQTTIRSSTRQARFQEEHSCKSRKRSISRDPPIRACRSETYTVQNF